MKTYTLQQARVMLPVLRAEMLVLQPAFKALRLKWESVAKEQGVSIDDPLVRKVCEADPVAQQLIERVEKAVSFFDELGVVCKGIDQGLFDFPCLLEDRIVYLCWQIDEDDISHWHELDAGYVGRRPLFEATAKSREQALVN